MANAYRIGANLGINNKINVQLDQDFDFLEILSLKITQNDVYTRNCSDYGVVVGRVSANNGYGLSNVKVSIFVPLSETDKENEKIFDLYPYESINDVNSDGYRYNLLPSVKSHSGHNPTGSFPSKDDVLNDGAYVEIFDKYYKYTVKTNDSGDYMVFGVPVGSQTVFVDIDLSDIGEFSLTPQDLIRMGLATENQVSGNRFKTSTNLNELPQIVSLQKSIEVSPFWGDENVCDAAINRVDFDLRADANIDIQPRAIFMGSLLSTSDKYRLRNNCKPKDDMGNLCGLESGPGQILSIRQTINNDGTGLPILEEYRLENSGNLIDEDGTWVVELPMNLNYITTNEYGEKVITNDPTIGIPTKGKYRFKIKWQQPNNITQQTRRAYFLVPNVREYWGNSIIDPNYNPQNTTDWERLSGSYYFGLDWSGYTNSDAAVACEDTFYEFNYNRVYSVSGLIDNYKNGSSRGKFIGIKEINDDTCSSVVNKFPVNDGVRNFDLIYFIFSILLQVIQMIGVPILISYHLIAFLWNSFAVPLLLILTAFFYASSVYFFIQAAAAAGNLGFLLIAGFIALGVLSSIAAVKLTTNFRRITTKRFGRFKLPMITYPACQACDCEQETIEDYNASSASSLLTQLSNNAFYYEGIRSNISDSGEADDDDVLAISIAEAMVGRIDDKTSPAFYKSTESKVYRLPSNAKKVFSYSSDLPLAERINLFNTRKKYFDGVNKIRVTFDKPINAGKQHFDSTVTLLLQDKLESGTLLSFVDPGSSEDVNYNKTYITSTGLNINGLTGNTKNTGYVNATVNYAVDNNTDASVDYLIYNSDDDTSYRYPIDIEYFQVVTAITVSDAIKIWTLNGDNSSLPKILKDDSLVYLNQDSLLSWGQAVGFSFNASDSFDGFNSQYITIFQRGVDPYSPKVINEYGVGKIFGYEDYNQITFTAETRLNIPIQKTIGVSTIQQFNIQSDIFNQSYFFTPGLNFSSFTTSNVGYYGSFDNNNYALYDADLTNFNGQNGVTTKNSNSFFDASPYSTKYDKSEDLSGGGYYYGKVERRGNNTPKNTDIYYYSPTFRDRFVSSPMVINDRFSNIFRTDRLPSSDFLDGSDWATNASLLQQNLGFSMYVITTHNDKVTIDSFGSGATTYTPDVENTIGYNALNSFDCTNMVGLKCYSGDGTSFGVKVNCQDEDTIENGCYIFMVRPLVDLGKDLKSFAEWGYRFRFFYGICRGVISETFSNNWVNGSLFAFPVQIDWTYNSENKLNDPIFCKDLIFFDEKTNNFYYRSSPYNINTNQFIGKRVNINQNSNNDRNLLFPTTIIDLGVKDSFYGELIFDPSAKMFVMDRLSSTSYGDTSDLINLFVISRIIDERFISQLLSFASRNNSLAQLFSRDNSRVDGDLAQLLSINSEEGLIKFSPEFYQSSGNTYDPVVFIKNQNKNSIGVFFSSTTEDLQYKDYVSPGRIDIRTPINNTLYSILFGNRSQLVPFYQWELSDSSTSIFGDENNDWATNSDNIIARRYQNLDRLSANDYYLTPNYIIDDRYARGYIFNVDELGRYVPYSTKRENNFIVGAPNHFYFGLLKGKTSLDKFKRKYLADE